MRIKTLSLLVLFALVTNCTSIKDVKRNTGSITVGNNNIVINLPQANKTYDQTEVQNEILYLQSVLNKIDYQIDAASKQEETIEEPNTNKPKKKDKEVIELRKKKAKLEEAIGLWRNYTNGVSSNIRSESFYRIMADSLRVENEKINLQKNELLTILLSENIDSDKLDSLLKAEVLKNAEDYPSDAEFVRELNLKSYNRMLTLWERNIDELAKSKSYYDFTFENKTPNDILVAIAYYSLDEQWVTEGWYTLSANSSDVRFKFYTDNSNFYVYGVAPSVNKEWAGSKNLEVAKYSEFTILEKYTNMDYDTKYVKFFHVKARSMRSSENIPFT